MRVSEVIRGAGLGVSLRLIWDEGVQNPRVFMGVSLISCPDVGLLK